MNIIGFDPASLVNLGWARLELSNTNGEITCEAGTFIFPHLEQKFVLASMYETLETFIVANKPDLVVLEKTSSFSGGFITGQISSCIGVLLAVCGKHQMPTAEVFPTHVKKIVSGSGKAKKKQMKISVTEVLGKLGLENVKFNSEHAYDAIANVLCYLHDNNVIVISRDEEEKK